MVRKVDHKPKSTIAHEAIPPATLQTGTKESPILLSSDDESGGEEGAHRPFEVNAVPQKRYLGVSPSDAYTFRGHGSAYVMMLAMGYKPDRGLGPNLRGSANSRYVSSVAVACLFFFRKCAALVDRTPEAQGWSRLPFSLSIAQPVTYSPSSKGARQDYQATQGTRSLNIENRTNRGKCDFSNESSTEGEGTENNTSQ